MHATRSRTNALNKSSDQTQIPAQIPMILKKEQRKINVRFTSNMYNLEDPININIGEFDDEKSGIAGVITWLIQTGNGGLDVSYLNELLFDSEDEKNEKELIQYLIETIKTWDELRSFCHKYGEFGCGFFEQKDGWWLRKNYCK